jgi:hypothetical protein
MKPEDRVRAHRHFGRDVADAEILRIDRLAVLLDQKDHAGDIAGRDFVADIVTDAIEPGARKASRGLASIISGCRGAAPRQPTPRQ